MLVVDEEVVAIRFYHGVVMDRPYFRCIVCNQPLSPSMSIDSDDDCYTPVNDGVHFQAYGNYGSSIFDLPDPPASHIEVVICDWCLIEKSNQVRLYMKKYEEFEEFKVGRFEDQLKGLRGPGPRPEPRGAELTPEAPESASSE